MKNFIKSVVLKSFFILLFLTVVWLTISKIPLIQAEAYLKKGVETFKSLSVETSLKEWLKSTAWSEIEIRSRGSINAYYDLSILARDEIRKRTDLTKDHLPQVNFTIFDSIFYGKVNQTINEANDQLKVDTEYYQKIYELFDYYEKSTLAIFNLIYYDPSTTIRLYQDNPDYELLLQRFGLDYAGLKKVEERLSALPSYNSDNLKEFTLPLVQPLTTKARAISDLAGQQKDKEAITLAEELDREVRIVQEKIVKNRQDFWKSVAKEELTTELDELRKKDLELMMKIGNDLIEINHRK